MLSAQAAERAKGARRKLIALLPLLIGLLALNRYRQELFGADEPVRIAVAITLLIIGWAFARQLGSVLRPKLISQLEPGVAGIAEFLVRLVAIIVMLFVSLRIAGVNLGALALGASFTAVVVGLAAQQTLGNMLAGIVLLSARPFSVGDRVKFVGGGVDTDGTVRALGLLYVTIIDGEDPVMLPNAQVLMMSIRPLREPAGVDMRARLPNDVDPEAVQKRIGETLTVATRDDPHVTLEEVDGDEVVVRIKAVPDDSDEGGALARDVLRAVADMTPDDGPAEQKAA